MGTKFSNLQVHSNDCEAVKAHCPMHTVTELADGWVTVLGSTIDWGTAQKEARRLSKLLPYSILSVEYFDDDFVELTVYKGGKKAAGHVPAEYESFARTVGKPKKFVEALDLPAEDEKLLKAIFQERSPELCVHLMESLLGCVLWVDEETVGEAHTVERSYLEDFLARKAEKNKIKNQTKLTLLDELEGEFDYHITYPVAKYEDRQWSEKSIWSVSPEGRLQKDFTTNELGRVEAHRAQARSDTMTVLTFGFWGGHDHKTTICCYANDGAVLERIECNDISALNAAILGDGILFREGACHDVRNHEVLWDLGIGRTGYGIEPPRVVSDGVYAIVYDQVQTESATMALIDNEGNVRCSIELPIARHWAYPIVHDGNIFMFYSLNLRMSALVCYDEGLNELWRVEMPGMTQLGKPVFDAALKTIFFHAAYDCLVSFDIESREVTASREIQEDECVRLESIVPGIGLVMLTGDSGIEVWGNDLKTIGRHRTKGWIEKTLQQNGRSYLITIKGSEGKDKPGIVRLYELTAIKKAKETGK